MALLINLHHLTDDELSLDGELDIAELDGGFEIARFYTSVLYGVF